MTINLNDSSLLDLRKRIKENPSEFVAIVGAGLSRPAGIPTWGELRDLLLEECQCQYDSADESQREVLGGTIKEVENESDLWRAFTQLKRVLPMPSYRGVIQKALEIEAPEKVPESYDLLWKLGIRGIVTFNLDMCAQHSFSRVHSSACNCATAQEISRFASFLTSPYPFVFQPHGIVSAPKTWVFTTGDRNELLSEGAAYPSFVTSLLTGKHVLILGFNPDDFVFKYLLQYALGPYDGDGPRHYALLNCPTSGLVSELGEKNISVIPYRPEDPESHSEVPSVLNNILSFVSRDGLESTVFDGPPMPISELPPDEKLLAMPVDESRQLLNRAIASILPGNKSPTQEDIAQLQTFYRSRSRSINDAWLVEPKSEHNKLHGFEIGERLGRGAFGQVYEAIRPETGDRQAVKILLQEVRNDPEFLNSFRRGIKSMRILSERKVDGMVRIHAAFEVPACVFMELIDGSTLREAVQQGMLDGLERRLEVLRSIARIVHNAHTLDEQVLHRDLKPENIILRDCYSAADPIDVVVVDFDLSWHWGASGLSVTHHTRPHGFAAPEQLISTRNEGESTRHTAVDTFGLGMVSYFVITGQEPRQNEHRFAGFVESIRKTVEEAFRPSWRSLPVYLAHTVEGCTQDSQSRRMPFSAALNALAIALEMCSLDALPTTHPALLLELGARTDVGAGYQTGDFDRELMVRSVDRSKSMQLELITQGKNVALKVTLCKELAEYDHRNVMKYLPQAKNRAASILTKAGFAVLEAETIQSGVKVVADRLLPSKVKLAEVEAIANCLANARQALDLQ